MPQMAAQRASAPRQQTMPHEEYSVPAGATIDEDYESSMFDTPQYDGAAGGHRGDCGGGECGGGRCGLADGDLGGCVVTSPPSVWARAEYLLWSTKAMHVPALATTSPTGTTQTNAGVLAQNGTTVLFGDTGLNGDIRSGGRFSAGGWFDLCHRNGIEVTYIVLAEQDESYNASSSALGILARPFFNVQTNEQDARLVGFPAVTSGFLQIESSTNFQTGEVLYRHVGCITLCSRTDFYLGYRYADLNDGVRISDSSLSLAGAATGSTVAIVDRFNTTNLFNGADVGVVWQYEACPKWCWEITGKVALGNTNSRANISGQTVTTTAAGAATTTSSGLLALRSNSGVFENNKFSSLGELGVTLRHSFKCGFTATCGYRFMYWTDVARAGKQIDTTINTSQIPPSTITGAARPAPPFHFSDFWAQGLHAGLECAF